MAGFNGRLCPAHLDERIEGLYRRLAEERTSLTHLQQHRGRGANVEREIQDLEERLDLTHQLIAGYSQLGVRQSIEDDASLEPTTEDDLERRSALLETTEVRWFRRQLRAWAGKHLRDLPWRRTQEPYAVLIAEIMLQQTRTETVTPIYRTFLREFPDLPSLADAPVEEIGRAIAPLGLNYRAVRLKELARTITEGPGYGGKLPHDEAGLLALPGVGRYTANAVLAGAFARPAAILDTNVARLFERFFGLEGGRVKSRDRMLWELAEAIAPERKVRIWNWTLIDFGALVCTARRPCCSSCPLRKRCTYIRDRA